MYSNQRVKTDNVTFKNQSRRFYSLLLKQKSLHNILCTFFHLYIFTEFRSSHNYEPQ